MTEAHGVSQPAHARVCLRWLDTPEERDVPHLVELCDEVTLPVERVLDGRTVYGSAGYVPARVLRRATRSEIEQWRER